MVRVNYRLSRIKNTEATKTKALRIHLSLTNSALFAVALAKAGL